MEKIYGLAQEILQEIRAKYFRFFNHFRIELSGERVACRNPCCLYMQKIHDTVENEEKEVKQTFCKQLKELTSYEILPKSYEESSKSIKQIKNM